MTPRRLPSNNPSLAPEPLNHVSQSSSCQVLYQRLANRWPKSAQLVERTRPAVPLEKVML
jgi:hypothetical protein